MEVFKASFELRPRPAELERSDPQVGQSQPCASTWEWERPYNGPPEDGQPRAGSASIQVHNSLIHANR
jgi:hypothetical protein